MHANVAATLCYDVRLQIIERDRNVGHERRLNVETQRCVKFGCDVKTTTFSFSNNFLGIDIKVAQHSFEKNGKFAIYRSFCIFLRNKIYLTDVKDVKASLNGLNFLQKLNNSRCYGSNCVSRRRIF